MKFTATLLLATGIAYGGQTSFSLNEAMAVHKKFEAAAVRGYEPTAQLVNIYMAPNFTYVAQGRTFTRAQWLAEFKKAFQTGKVSSFRFTLGKPMPKNGKVMLPGSLYVKGTAKLPGKKKSSVLASRETFVETWTNADGKWMIEKIESKTMKMWADGKPYNPPMAAPLRKGG